MKINGKKTSGFSLVELLIAMAISLVVLTSVSSAFISQRKTYHVQEQITEMTQGARAAMEIITREVKMGGFNPIRDPAMVGIPYNASQLEIRADLNGDGETDGSSSADDTNEEIIYTHDGANFEIDRDTGSGGKTLAENITSFTFGYLDGDGNATTTPADVRMIQIAITARTADPDPDYTVNSGYRTHTLTSRVSPPNLAIGQ